MVYFRAFGEVVKVQLVIQDYSWHDSVGIPALVTFYWRRWRQNVLAESHGSCERTKGTQNPYIFTGVTKPGFTAGLFNKLALVSGVHRGELSSPETANKARGGVDMAV